MDSDDEETPEGSQDAGVGVGEAEGDGVGEGDQCSIYNPAGFFYLTSKK